MRAGIDIGGTKTDAVAVDADGTVGSRLRMPTESGASGVLDTARSAVTELAAVAGVSVGDFESIGVGVPGTVDVTTGRVAHAVNLGVDELDLGGALEGLLGRGVHVENDVNAAALGAFHALGLREDDSMAYLNLGTGLAAGLVVGGELWRGATGNAGEIGHIPVDPNGPLCTCGQRGCLETLASGSAASRLWPTDDQRAVNALFAAAARGDESAAEVKRMLVEGIAAAVRLLVLTADPHVIAVGGGVSSLGDELIAEVSEVLDGWGASSRFLASMELSSRLRLVPNDVPVAALGAAFVGAEFVGSV